ncbi:MAG: RluA family pseudouridine synthase [Mycoplasma sp.]
MIEIRINHDEVDTRLNVFLLDYFPDWTKSTINKKLKNQMIKINGKKKDFNYRLRRNDVLVIYEDGEEPENNLEQKKYIMDLWFTEFSSWLDIVYEDENFVIINKQVGLMSHPNHTICDSVQTRLLHYLYEKREFNPSYNNTFIPSICHRLDRNTSGLLICAKNAKSLAAMNKAIMNREVTKNYRCLVYGQMPQDHEKLIAYHFKNSYENVVYISSTPKEGYKEILTEYTVVWYKDGYSCIDINLISGRTHQIRAHLNFIKHPIVGERKYNSNTTKQDDRFSSQALLCNKLSFNIKPSSPIAYLNKKVFTVNDVWFEDNLKRR